MNPGGATGGDDLEVVLDALVEADELLRALYRQLAENPDLASEHEIKLKELHAKRRDLAQQVGLATLARIRASADAVPAEQAATAAPKAADDSGPVIATALESAQDENPPSPPASEAQLAQWRSTVQNTGLGARLNGAPSSSTAWPLVLHELMTDLGPPRSLDTTVDVIEETDALDAVGTPERQALWSRLPRSAQQAWLSVLVARTRALREHPSPSEATKAKVKEIIGRYPPWAKTYNPGHVNGMQVKHAPAHGSWLQDSRLHWAALNDLLGVELGARQPTASKKTRKRVEAEPRDESENVEMDSTWRLLPLVRGLNAVMLGGDPREPNRQRLERAFQLASLDWPPIDGPRKVDPVVERIGEGTYGLVLVLQPFVAHSQSQPIIEAAKEAGTPWALAEGYGVSAVRLGLERFLGGPKSLVPR